jgi:histone-lysine N-methyltransferase SETMAR
MLNRGKTRMSSSKFKALLIFFFVIQSDVMAECVRKGQTVNQQYYIEIVTKLHKRVRRKRQEIWRSAWILNQDKAKVHNALSIKQCLTNKNITVLGHPPYSPDLAPCKFYFFPRIKSVLKQTNFLSVEN